MRTRPTSQSQDVSSRARALAVIPAETRQVLLMKEYEGLTFLEIAKILDIPVSTVKTRMYMGLRELRERLEDRDDRHRPFVTVGSSIGGRPAGVSGSSPLHEPGGRRFEE